MYKKIKLSVILRGATLIQRLLFLPNVPGATFIPDSRVDDSHLLSSKKLEDECC